MFGKQASHGTGWLCGGAETLALLTRFYFKLKAVNDYEFDFQQISSSPAGPGAVAAKQN